MGPMGRLSLVITSLWVDGLFNNRGMLKPKSQKLGQRLEDIFGSVSE